MTRDTHDWTGDELVEVFAALANPHRLRVLASHAGGREYAAVIIWQFVKTRRANATLAREDSYRKLAEEAVAAERQTGRELAELRERAAEIERILRQVE